MTKFEKWLDEVNQKRKVYWDSNFTHTEYQPLTFKKGQKYVKIIDRTSVWGFVSMKDGVLKGCPISMGDLLMAAGWNAPAKHSRGNIFKGTDQWSFYGPSYLK